MNPVALFIPCYVDQLYPEVGLATARVLERLGVKVEFPEAQTCCGQPMANAGATLGRGASGPPLPRRLRALRVRRLPLGQLHRDGATPLRRRPARRTRGSRAVAAQTLRAVRVLHRRARGRRIAGSFPRRVGLHQSCHGLRELRLGSGSERMVEPWNKVRALLASLDGIELVELTRPDECCGFGGMFAVDEEAVSGAYGPRPHRRPRAGRRRGGDRDRHVVPDAPGRNRAAAGRRSSPPRGRGAGHGDVRSRRLGAHGTKVGPSMNAHARAAAKLVRDDARVHWHDAAVWNVRAKRDRAAHGVPEWETLRDAASRIKLHTMSRLAEYLEQFERNATPSAPRSTGPRRRRAQRDRPRDPPGARRHAGGEEQVDAHRGVRPQSVSGDGTASR